MISINKLMRLMGAIGLDIAILISISLYIFGPPGIAIGECLATIFRSISVVFIYTTRDKKKSQKTIKTWLITKLIPGFGNLRTNTLYVLREQFI